LRKHILEALRAHGCTIDGRFGIHRVQGLVCTSEERELDGPFAAVLLTVKAYDTAAMAAARAPHLSSDGVLVSLQNGLGNLEAASRVLGSERVLGARVIFGAELVEAGHA